MNLKIPSCQKNIAFFCPKKFASPCYVFGREFLISPSQKSFPSPARNPPKSRTFSFSPKGLEPWGTKKKGCESAHKANFQKPYAIFFLGILLLLRLDSFFFVGGRGPKPKSNDTMFLGLLCSSCVFCTEV